LAQDAKAECAARLKELPTKKELLLRGAMAEGFAELAVAGAGQNAETAARLQKARDGLRQEMGHSSVQGATTELWILEDAWVEALRKNGDLAQARYWAEGFLNFFGGSWGPNGPGEFWRGQKHLAMVRLQAASSLDSAVPAEAAHRKELLDRVAATLAPDKVAGRLTVDVQEMLREIERLRTAPPPAN
jgi:hypothetical protein